MSQNDTEIALFEPTDKMVEYLDTAVRLLSDSPSKVAEQCDVARKSWYRWLKIEGFEDWFYNEYKRRRARIIPKLDQVGMQMAKKDFRYWEAMNKKVDDLPERSTKAGVSIDDGNKVIKLVLDIPKG